MLSFAAPAWLLGLLLVPVIRWLHRGGRPRAAVPVARAALWRAAPAEWPAEGARQPPDPAWRRRALLAALLALALAGPQWPLPQTRITLWVDDSPSMLTREVGGTRLSVGLAQARSALATLPGAEVELRTLSAPWRLRAIGDALPAAGAPPAPPPAALLRADREHWLLTDGTNAALQAWPGGQRAARVLQVGSVARNVGITSVAARRPAGDPAFVDVRVRLTNGGDRAEARELLVAGEGGAAQRLTVDLAAGATETRQLRLPQASRLQVRLTPGDALPEDDEAALDLAALLPLPVRVDAACPPALRAAVAAHPGLADVAAGEAMRVACGSTAAPVPALRWLGEQLPTPLNGAPHWAAELPAARQVPLAPDRLRVTGRPALSSGARVLLAADGQALMVLRGGPQPVLDMALDAASLGPDLPLLLNFAAEQLMGRSLLDPVAVLDRGTAAARVVPGVAPPAETGGASAASAQADGTAWLLWPALLVLVWEIVALARRWRDAAVGLAELPQ